MKMNCVAIVAVLTSMQITLTDTRVNNVHTRRAMRACYVPSGPLYRRSVYRRRYGSNISPLPPRARVSHNTVLSVVCKKDRAGDSIMKHHKTICRYGRWRPALPKCKAHKPCRAPVVVMGARPTERIPPKVTYRHKRLLTYTCDGNTVLVGDATRTCNQGAWSPVNFRCDAPVYDPCNNMSVSYGNVAKSVKSPTLYRVTCDSGFQIVPQLPDFSCRDGNWIHEEPRCVPVSCPDIDAAYTVSTCSPFSAQCQSSSLVHGTAITIRCKKRELPYRGVKTAKCVQGSWRPWKPMCRGTCRLPSPTRTTSIFKSLKTGKVASGQIAHRQRVLQSCRWARNGAKRQSTCINGRWRPRTMICPKRSKMRA